VAIASVAVLGVFGTGVAIWLFNKLIYEQGPLFAGMVTNLVPIGAVLWGWADDEVVTAIQIWALVGIVLMVSLVQFGAASRGVRPIEEAAA
jgi:drug/metabolite transporter (DMT)-like permease